MPSPQFPIAGEANGGACECVCVCVAVSRTRTSEKMPFAKEMPWRQIEWSNEPLLYTALFTRMYTGREHIRWGSTLAPPGDYDKMIARRRRCWLSIATIAVATYYYC